jgi:hypothetical protein
MLAAAARGHALSGGGHELGRIVETSHIAENSLVAFRFAAYGAPYPEGMGSP